jgi:hypothetical protein
MLSENTSGSEILAFVPWDRINKTKINEVRLLIYVFIY